MQTKALYYGANHKPLSQEEGLLKDNTEDDGGVTGLATACVYEMSQKISSNVGEQ